MMRAYDCCARPSAPQTRPFSCAPVDVCDGLCIRNPLTVGQVGRDDDPSTSDGDGPASPDGGTEADGSVSRRPGRKR